MSTIELTISERGAKAAAPEREESVLGAAWGDARERFAENVASAIVWAGGAVPILALLAALAAAGRLLHRRRQRAAARVADGGGA